MTKTASHVASQKRNQAALRFLCSTVREADRQLIYDEFLLFRQDYLECPVADTIMNRDMGVAECLLELQREYARPSQLTVEQSSSDICASSQWSFLPEDGFDPALCWKWQASRLPV
jgi:hypothetical protein